MSLFVFFFLFFNRKGKNSKLHLSFVVQLCNHNKSIWLITRKKKLYEEKQPLVFYDIMKSQIYMKNTLQFNIAQSYFLFFTIKSTTNWGCSMYSDCLAYILSTILFTSTSLVCYCFSTSLFFRHLFITCWMWSCSRGKTPINFPDKRYDVTHSLIMDDEWCW